MAHDAVGCGHFRRTSGRVIALSRYGVMIVEDNGLEVAPDLFTFNGATVPMCIFRPESTVMSSISGRRVWVATGT